MYELLAESELNISDTYKDQISIWLHQRDDTCNGMSTYTYSVTFIS